ncbi:unknow [Vibrio campbellii]|nr:unknow [Vibrio campbellii]
MALSFKWILLDYDFTAYLILKALSYGFLMFCVQAHGGCINERALLRLTLT